MKTKYSVNLFVVSILFFGFLLSGCGGGGGSKKDAETNNTQPVANAQTVQTIKNTAKTITLTGSDTEGDTLTYTLVTQPTNGVLSGTAPNLTYTPNANYVGTDTFTFTVNDGNLDSNAATITINIDAVAVNVEPIASSQVVYTIKNIAKDITLGGSDADGDTLTYTITANPLHGSLSGVAPNLTYTPYIDYIGADTFTFIVSDGTVNSNIATVTINIMKVDLSLKSAVYFDNGTSTINDDTLNIYFSKAIDPASINSNDIGSDYNLTGDIQIGSASTSNYATTNNIFFKQAISLNSDGTASVKAGKNDTIALKLDTITDTQGQHPLNTPTPITIKKPNYFALLKTGQTTSYYPGDDGDLEKEMARSYYRRTLPLVRDNVTGLIWQDNSDVADSSKRKDWANAKAYCNNLTFGGYNDWRLPTVEELMSITHKGKYNPAMDDIFKNVASSYYWSSTTSVVNTSNALSVGFVSGNDYWYNKATSLNVRCVRGEESSMEDSQFLRDDSKEVVLDTKTNLIWQDNSEVSDSSKKKNWGSAISYCKNLTLGGFTNWRLPNFNELYNLADRSKFNPAISSLFKNVASFYYWSSTTEAFNTNRALLVSFRNGSDYISSKTTRSYYVRCVHSADN